MKNSNRYHHTSSIPADSLHANNHRCTESSNRNKEEQIKEVINAHQSHLKIVDFNKLVAFCGLEKCDEFKKYLCREVKDLSKNALDVCYDKQ